MPGRREIYDDRTPPAFPPKMAAMPGRYSLTDPPGALRTLFGIAECPIERPLYNIAPTWNVPVIRPAESGGLEAIMMRWGLLPPWARKITEGAKLHNARCETLAEKRTFRRAFAARRCLLPLDGFFVWHEQDKQKKPYRVCLKGGSPFAAAGLWERWTAPGREDREEGGILSCTLVTTDSPPGLAHLDSRMPVILDAGDYATWLSIENAHEALTRLYEPPAESALDYYPVSERVNKTKNDPLVVERLPEAG